MSSAAPAIGQLANPEPTTTGTRARPTAVAGEPTTTGTNNTPTAPAAVNNLNRRKTNPESHSSQTAPQPKEQNPRHPPATPPWHHATNPEARVPSTHHAATETPVTYNPRSCQPRQFLSNPHIGPSKVRVYKDLPTSLSLRRATPTTARTSSRRTGQWCARTPGTTATTPPLSWCS
jgi:hypothetical protein